MPDFNDIKIDPTAIVEPGAEIGSQTAIWHWTHVCAGAKIGEKCSIGQGCYIGKEALIGNRVKIQNHVSVYDKVELEDDVFCGPSVVFTNVYNPRSEVVRKSEYKYTRIKKGASLGANCTIVCGVTIGAYAFVGAGSLIRTDVPEYALYVGNPAQQIGWISRHGVRLELPIYGFGRACCPQSGQWYELLGNQCHFLGEDSSNRS